jgi:hypothetical protein
MYLALIGIAVMLAIIVCIFPIFSCVLHLRFSVVGLLNCSFPFLEGVY